jgi:hypothetical protein
VTEVLRGGGRDRAVKQRAACQQWETVFIFLSTAKFLSGHNLFACRERERERERKRACARSFSSWTTFFPVAKELEMVEEVVDDARSVC